MHKMLANMRARRDDEQGFTLIELMVVVLIIAILIAIAIPTFLGAKSRAQDKSAQSSLRNALTNAKGIYTDSETYLNPDVAGTVTQLIAAEPSLTFQTAASTGPKVVSIDATAGVFVAAALSKSGKCYALRDTVSGPGTEFATVTGACSGANATATATFGASW